MNRNTRTLIVVLIALASLLQFALGLLFWLGLAAVVGGITIAVVRGWAQERTLNQAANPRHERRLDKQADRALNDLEKKIKS